jgi:hypothetical protein
MIGNRSISMNPKPLSESPPEELDLLFGVFGVYTFALFRKTPSLGSLKGLALINFGAFGFLGAFPYVFCFVD